MDCRAEFETFAVLKSRTCKAEIIRNSVSGVRWNIDHSPQSVYFRHTRLFKEMLCFQHHTFVSSTASRYSSCFFKKKNLKIVCFKHIVENSFVDIVIIPDVGWRACSPTKRLLLKKSGFSKQFRSARIFRRHLIRRQCSNRKPLLDKVNKAFWTRMISLALTYH